MFPGSLGGPIDPSVLTRTFEKLVRRIDLTPPDYTTSDTSMQHYFFNKEQTLKQFREG